MNRKPESVVALMVRPPVPGQVKTRLAAGIGAEGACRLYRAMVADILANSRGAGVPIHLFHAGTENHALPQAWREAVDQVRPQRGNDIGERMAAVFADCFAEGIEQVILAGSDLPELGAGIIRQALAALTTHDAALVPTVDGGYGLIALQSSRYRPQLFREIPWSTGQVLALTRQRFEECVLSVCMLPLLRDIDTLDDLLAYRQHPCPAATATNEAMADLLTKFP
jgi:hypothetical protein